MPAIISDSSVCTIIKKFNLPYTGNLSLDSNSLIFYGDRAFDTSFLLHVRKDIGKINVTYYEVLPNYHRFLNDVRVSDRQALFFEGYGFVLDSSTWKIIKNKAAELPPTDTNTKSNPIVRDGDHFAFLSDMGVKKSNSMTSVQYAVFYKFLKDSLLDDLINERIPIMHKKNNASEN